MLKSCLFIFSLSLSIYFGSYSSCVMKGEEKELNIKLSLIDLTGVKDDSIRCKIQIENKGGKNVKIFREWISLEIYRGEQEAIMGCFRNEKGDYITLYIPRGTTRIIKLKGDEIHIIPDWFISLSDVCWSEGSISENPVYKLRVEYYNPKTEKYYHSKYYEVPHGRRR